MLERLGRLSTPSQRWLLALGCIVLFGLWLTHVPLTERDETRYAEATREMLESGDVLIPAFNYTPRYQKPIGYYWLQAPFVKLFGVNEVAARLPSAAVTLVMVLLLHGMLLRWLPAGATGDFARGRARGAAFLGAAALAVVPLVAIWARAAVTDPTLTLFMTMTMLALMQADLRGAANDPRAARRWYYVAAVAAGLAFLTKGPLGILIPVLAWLLYHGVQKSLAAEARRVPWLGAIVLFLLVAAPWYLTTYVVDGPGFLTRFFGVENAQRFAGAMEGHGFDNRLLGFFFYLPVAWLFLFPISPFLIRELVQPFGGNPAIARQASYQRLRRFAWCWVAATLLILSPAATKLPSYIMPLAGATAILFAIHLIGRLAPGSTTAEPSRLTTAGTVLENALLTLAALAWVAGPVVFLVLEKITGPFGPQPLPHPLTEIIVGLLAIPGLLMLVMIAVWALRRRPARLISWTVGCWAVLLLVLLLGVAPLVIRAAYGPSVAIGRFLRTQAPEAAVYTYLDGKTCEGLVYYARRRVNFLPYAAPEALTTLIHELNARRTVLVITDTTGYRMVKDLGNSSVLKEIGAFRVVKLASAVASEQRDD